MKDYEEEWTTMMVNRQCDGGKDIDTMDPSRMKALVTTINKRLHQTKSKGGSGVTNAEDATPCLIHGCNEKCSLPICRLHFASMVCGKTPALQLKNNYGIFKYDKDKHQAIYPASVPAEKLKKIVRGRGRSSKGSSPKKE